MRRRVTAPGARPNQLTDLMTQVYGPFISRAQAKAQGLKHYFTGKPCKQGHNAPHRISGACWECLGVGRQYSRNCLWCENLFTTSRKHTQYCCKSCNTKGWCRANPQQVRAHTKSANSKVINGETAGQRAYKRRKERAEKDPSYRKKLRDRKNNATKKWVENNRAHVTEWRRNYESTQYKTDIQYKLTVLYRSRVYAALKNQESTKDVTSKQLMGGSVNTVIKHIEANFLPGMSWGNWSHDVWHIDHIRPCASFDLTDPEQQTQCFHYTNLQPLWAKDNLQKSDKWSPDPNLAATGLIAA